MGLFFQQEIYMTIIVVGNKDITRSFCFLFVQGGTIASSMKSPPQKCNFFVQTCEKLGVFVHPPAGKADFLEELCRRAVSGTNGLVSLSQKTQKRSSVWKSRRAMCMSGRRA